MHALGQQSGSLLTELGNAWASREGEGTALTFCEVRAEVHMERFSVGQRWIIRDDIFGTFLGEVIEVSDDGRSVIVVITDDRDNVLDTFSGSAADFQASGKWQLPD